MSGKYVKRSTCPLKKMMSRPFNTKSVGEILANGGWIYICQCARCQTTIALIKETYYLWAWANQSLANVSESRIPLKTVLC